MNAWMNPIPKNNVLDDQSWNTFQHYKNGPNELREFRKQSDITCPGPSMCWVTIDENPFSINDGWFYVDMTGYRAFADFPATRHNRGYGISFCDGHAEIFKMHDPRSNWPVPGNINAPENLDFSKLRDVSSAPQ